MKDTDIIIYRVWKRMWYGSVYVHYVKGTKKELYSFIGFQYSNSLDRIDRISYFPATEKQIAEMTEYFTVSDGGLLCRHLKDEIAQNLY